MRFQSSRVTVMTVVTAVSGYPLCLSLTPQQSEIHRSCPTGGRRGGDDNAFPICALPPCGRTPRNRTVQAWAFLASLGSQSHPCGCKNRPGFYSPLLQGVTHYTLQARSCARLSLWTPFMQGLRPAPRRLRLRGKAAPVTVPHRFRGHPKTTVITVTTVTAQRTLAEKERRSGDYALRNPAFPETQGRLRGCL